MWQLDLASFLCQLWCRGKLTKLLEQICALDHCRYAAAVAAPYINSIWTLIIKQFQSKLKTYRCILNTIIGEHIFVNVTLCTWMLISASFFLKQLFQFPLIDDAVVIFRICFFNFSHWISDGTKIRIKKKTAYKLWVYLEMRWQRDELGWVNLLLLQDWLVCWNYWSTGKSCVRLRKSETRLRVSEQHTACTWSKSNISTVQYFFI